MELEVKGKGCKAGAQYRMSEWEECHRGIAKLGRDILPQVRQRYLSSSYLDEFLIFVIIIITILVRVLITNSVSCSTFWLHMKPEDGQQLS